MEINSALSLKEQLKLCKKLVRENPRASVVVDNETYLVLVYIKMLEERLAR
jgi:hypothetical protein